MRFDVVSLFPDMFSALKDSGLVGQALERGLIELHTLNPRSYALNRYGSVDDRPFGGGDGMIMSPQPLAQAVQAVKDQVGSECYIILLSTAGAPLDTKICEELSHRQQLTLVCGRYGGVDQRFVTRFVDREISIGDYILSGGELAALVLIDAVARLIPGVLGNEVSAREESFFTGLLEAPQFTRPAEFAALPVPEILLSGHHEKIAKWRRLVAILCTQEHRPDLLKKALEKGLVQLEELKEARTWAHTLSEEQKELLGLHSLHL